MILFLISNQCQNIHEEEEPGPSNLSNLSPDEWYAVVQDPRLLTRARCEWVCEPDGEAEMMADQSERYHANYLAERHHAYHMEANRQKVEMLQQARRHNYEFMKK